jgi:hypothetical protein
MEGKTKDERNGRIFSYSLFGHFAFFYDTITSEQCQALFAFLLAVG